MAIEPTVRCRREEFRRPQEGRFRILIAQRACRDTGGKFYRNTNDIKAGLTALLEENAGYYLLGFQPDVNKWDGKFHKIKVVVRGRPDLNVSSRKGYLAKTDKPKDQRNALSPKAAEIMEAITLRRSPRHRPSVTLLRDDAPRA